MKFGRFRRRRYWASIIGSTLAFIGVCTYGLMFHQANAQSYVEVCEGSYYTAESSSNMTASGEYFDGNDATAAHKTLPFDTWVHVTNLDTGAEGNVRINDRGPYVSGRCIDVSGAMSYLVTGGGSTVELSV